MENTLQNVQMTHHQSSQLEIRFEILFTDFNSLNSLHHLSFHHHNSVLLTNQSLSQHHSPVGAEMMRMTVENSQTNNEIANLCLIYHVYRCGGA